MRTAWVRCWFRPHAAPVAARGGWLVAFAVLLLALAAAPPLRADGLELTALELTRNEDGLLLGYNARLELPRAVEDALLKGVPLYFQARVEVFRPRWYWRDLRVLRATRNWRVTWQPLTRRYRVNFGSLSQSYDTLGDALGAVQRSARWRLADAPAVEDGDYLEFSFRLDTSQLPRPLQIGFDGQADWELVVERRVAVPAAAPPQPPAPAAAPAAAPPLPAVSR